MNNMKDAVEIVDETQRLGQSHGSVEYVRTEILNIYC